MSLSVILSLVFFTAPCFSGAERAQHALPGPTEEVVAWLKSELVALKKSALFRFLSVPGKCD